MAGFKSFDKAPITIAGQMSPQLQKNPNHLLACVRRALQGHDVGGE
jgi:hypothetical protein